MRWFLLALLSTTGAVIVCCCLVALLVRSRVHRHHRVDPRVDTPAPLTWLADPRTPARLHRRLARVGRLSERVAAEHRPVRRFARRAPEPPPLVELATSLRARAVELDAQLARVALLAPAARRRPLGQLHAATAELEATSRQLAELSAAVLAPPVLATELEGTAALAARLDHLAQAHRELLEIDERNGLATTPRAGLATGGR
ncbi:MAG: hypothetical protein KDB04_13550 [Acidimicrobiales bacterium]|nr:hypothetical protein [Acidimicrobiales bacterium]HRW38215.1 hypothetical protein [Aquihabitans sp.]